MVDFGRSHFLPGAPCIMSFGSALSLPGWYDRRNSAILKHKGDLYLIGGTASTIPLSDIWISTNNGSSWSLLNDDPAWAGRFACVRAVSFQGAIWLVGIRDDPEGPDDEKLEVWRSGDGITWHDIPTNPAIVIPDGLTVTRNSFDLCVHQDRIWLVEGIGGTVWRLNGIQWDIVAAGAPFCSPGFGNSRTFIRVCSFGGALYVAGGASHEINRSLIFRSADGVLWESKDLGSPITAIYADTDRLNVYPQALFTYGGDLNTWFSHTVKSGPDSSFTYRDFIAVVDTADQIRFFAAGAATLRYQAVYCTDQYPLSVVVRDGPSDNTITVSRYPDLPGVFRVSCPFSDWDLMTDLHPCKDGTTWIYPYFISTEQRLYVRDHLAGETGEGALRGTRPFYLILHTSFSASWVSNVIPPHHQEDFTSGGVPFMRITGRNGLGALGYTSTYPLDPLKSGSSASLACDYENLEGLMIGSEPLYQYWIRASNSAQCGRAGLSYSGFEALVIVPPVMGLDPSEYEIPAGWWDDPDDDGRDRRRRRASWLAGAGGRFSGFLAGEIRGA